MSQVLNEFPDAEEVVMAILELLAPSVQTTPPDFVPPMIQVRQTGGTSGLIDTRPLVEVSFFGSDYPAARELAAKGEQMMLSYSGRVVQNVEGHPGGVLVDRIQVTTSPREVTYEDQDARRKTSAFRLVMRRSTL